MLIYKSGAAHQTYNYSQLVAYLYFLIFSKKL